MRRLLPFYVIAAVVVIAGSAAFGVPIPGLWILGIDVVCPLMMMVMMGGPRGGGDERSVGQKPRKRRAENSRPRFLTRSPTGSTSTNRSVALAR